MAITDELRHLEQYLLDEFQKGRRVADLYELVQYAGNIVPRLYLLITVGIVYIKTNTSLKQSILRDLVEMCRGVQHPLRGLFLRSYLLQCTRNILPDTINMEAKGEGTVYDSIDFVLMNFAEMNKLWVRMQHQGHSSEKQQREKEREELKILVGTNLVRLSQLDSATLEIYAKLILPGILEQVVSCRDDIAQEYLMECIIQVFPDEFHLQTLDPFLKSCAQLQSKVNVKNIIISLIDRLAAYNQRNGKALSSAAARSGAGGGDADSAADTIAEEVQLFEVFSKQISNIVQVRTDMPLENTVSLQIALVRIAQKVYSDRIDYVDKVLETTDQILQRLNMTNIKHTLVVNQELSRLLRMCVDFYNNIQTILELKCFAPILNRFDYHSRKSLSLYIMLNILDYETVIPTPEEADQVFNMLAILIRDPEGDMAAASESNSDPDDFSEEQGIVARFIHQLRSENPDTQFRILQTARKHLEVGGNARLKHVMAPIIFRAYHLAFRYKAVAEEDPLWDKKCQKILEFCHQVISVLAKQELSDLALRLYLQGALCIDQIKYTNHETVAYDFITRAVSLYEDEISDSKSQLAAITLIISTYEQITCFGEENADPLRTNFALAASKLLKKPDQSRAVALCSHLFWSGKQNGSELRDEKKTLDCLRKAERIAANQCIDDGVIVQLYVELLNHNVFYYEAGHARITVQVLNKIIENIQAGLPKLEESEEKKQIEQHLSNTIEHIKMKMETKGQLQDPNAPGPLYEGIVY